MIKPMLSRQRALAGWLLVPLLLAALPAASLAQAAEYPRQAMPSDLWRVYLDARQNNSELAAARADQAARAEAVPQARAGLLPTLSASAELNGTSTSLQQPKQDTRRSGTSYQAVLNQPIFRADRWFSLKAAEAEDQQAQLELAAAEQKLMLDSAQAYFGLLKAQDALAAAKAEEAALKRQLELAEKGLQLGLSDRTDVLQAEAGHDTARANRIVAQKRTDDAFEALDTLTHQQYAAIQGVRHDMPVLLPEPNDARRWVDTAVRQNLTLLASQHALDATQQTLSARKAGHAPTLDAVLRYQTGDNDNLGYGNSDIRGSGYGGNVEQRSVGLQLNIPLFSGGQTSSQVREAHQRMNQREYLNDNLRRQVVEQTRNLHRGLNSGVDQVKARRQSIISNQGAVLASQLGFQVGTRNIVDVLEAQRQLYNAVRQYNDSRYDYILDTLRLKQSVGTLSPQDLKALGDYLKADYDPDRDFLPPEFPRRLAAR
ncbi:MULTISPECIES: TolC family outer membrane protein [Pseudomonas]|nr:MULTISPECIES: TolC family outer membrane protein [Pseudomonas]AZC51399.1 Outer membrane channel TolC (OpmH) [Pseudomonas chlororaphis subsp. piscium]AZC57970.1 Outer membrane channel TolC (OpmH) [Pseudomonas chlororaphis subsp. piscium]AZC64204.1 Outer membrane channel TolC (OpmH) [Pseudomonas chlororaphis subsp. piscium]AZC76692.1 Outer membrane channel TolC (OpmH) [Pseudomonas chlororaphis subsp. piscium]AZC82916.1 Outer membrane channel TolC (OpmH) [Pseudomonas chlororaphis subsp. pisciu